MKQSSIYLLVLLLTLTQCDWLKKKDPEPDLPNTTQEGKNTFGCRVNGAVWLPAGRPGLGKANLSLLVDPGWRGGNVGIIAYREVKDKIDQIMGLSVDSVPKYGEATYPLRCVVNLPYIDGGAAIFRDYITQCEYYCGDQAQLLNGSCTLTTYDLDRRIVAGTFAFTLAMPGCDTIRVTDGRFDMQLY